MGILGQDPGIAPNWVGGGRVKAEEEWCVARRNDRKAFLSKRDFLVVPRHISEKESHVTDCESQ